MSDAAVQTATEVMATVLPTRDDARRAAQALDAHGLLHTYAPHTNPGEDSPHTRPGATRAAWYEAHDLTDPDAES